MSTPPEDTQAATTLRLAELVVVALELGTGKVEGDIAAELFATFELDLVALDRRIPLTIPNREATLQAQAAADLAAAAPSTVALMNEVLRCGARFIAMVEDIYQLLAEHVATTTGTSETFRIERDGIDASITISPAFLAELRELVRGLRQVTLWRFDWKALAAFTLPDGGEFYGRWPVGGANGFRLLDAALQVRRFADDDRVDAQLRDATVEAVDALAGIAEDLISAHMMRLDTLREDDVAEVYDLDSDGVAEGARRELGRYRESRALTGRVHSHYFAGLDDDVDIGLSRGGDGGLEPIVSAPTEHSPAPMTSLAQWVAMWRAGVRAQRSDSDVPRSRPELQQWLDTVRRGCVEASAWLLERAATPVGIAEAEVVVERIQEFLDLPLWHGRDLLYEIWIQTQTLRACQAAGWDIALVGVTSDDATWVLPAHPGADPVAQLTHPAAPDLALDVCREPRRQTATGPLTPDVTIATRGDFPRDLVVVEAKDKVQLALGDEDRKKSALGVANKYRPLQANVTWICNHCDFRRGNPSPEVDHGDAWSRVHVAGRFRPGEVPPSFATSIAAALTPPGMLLSGEPDHSRGLARNLVLVVDVTWSFFGELSAVSAALSDLAGAFELFRTVEFADHGPRDAFVLRERGPVTDLHALFDDVLDDVPGDGGDVAEALEDAMARCRRLADELGPVTVLVLTDAPPHPASDCPNGIDFTSEVRELLAGGSACLVATDWGATDRGAWDAFAAAPRMFTAPLATLVRQLTAGQDGVARVS